jgi:hypothetical protein
MPGTGNAMMVKTNTVPALIAKLEGKDKHTIITQGDEWYDRILFLNLSVCISVIWDAC